MKHSSLLPYIIDFPHVPAEGQEVININLLRKDFTHNADRITLPTELSITGTHFLNPLYPLIQSIHLNDFWQSKGYGQTERPTA